MIFDGLAQNPAENLGGFRVGQFAPRDFQFLADQSLGAFEGQRHKCADIAGGNRLVRLIRANEVR